MGDSPNLFDAEDIPLVIDKNDTDGPAFGPGYELPPSDFDEVEA